MYPCPFAVAMVFHMNSSGLTAFFRSVEELECYKHTL